MDEIVNYWLDLDIWRSRVKPGSYPYKMIDLKENGTSYPNIKRIKVGDIVIFVNSLLCYANGIIIKKDIDSTYSGNRPAPPYPVTILYDDIEIWPKDVSLKDQEIINFLAKVPFENSKYGTFLKDSTEKTIKILPQRLASEFQRINNEIFDYLKMKGTGETK